MKIAFDIGANKGQFTNFFLKSGFDKVITVEANPALAEALSQRFTGQPVVVVNKAVSDSTDQLIDFYLCSDDGISSVDESWPVSGRFAVNPHYHYSWTKTKVESITVDELVRLYGAPTHIKMDIEGHEAVALRGMSVAYCPLRFEWEEEKLDEVEKVLKHLASIGYYSFGIVVEQGEGESMDCDQRPTKYFHDTSEFMTTVRTAIKIQRSTNRSLKKDDAEQFADDHEMMFWGMIWCFREIDSQKRQAV